MKCQWRPLRITSLLNCVTLWSLLLLAFLLVNAPFLIIWWHEKPLQSRKGVTIPLDMETESIDDMYAGCRSETAALIDRLGVNEWPVNIKLNQAWAAIEKLPKKPAHKHIRDVHAKVLYMYTYWYLRSFRKSFDQNVKALKQGYSTYGFRYHYLYFYLIDAIQLLRGNQTWCKTTYLNTDKQFNQDVINKEIRLGSITLTSSHKFSHLTSGKVSCFEIITCFGADISYYSGIEENGQVLIPPYEVFKVTNVLTSRKQRCAVVYKLQSTKTPKSDLNCKLGPRKQDSNFTEFLLSSESASLILLIILSVLLIKLREAFFVIIVIGTLLVVLVIAEIVASLSV